MYYITEADIMWCDGCPVCVLEAAEVEELIAQTHHTNKKKQVDFNIFQLFVCHISNRLVRSLHFSLSV